MRKIQVFSLPIALVALLLVGCNGPKISREEAVAMATQIDEYYTSEAFVVPTKYSVTRTTRETTSTSHTESTMNVDVDFELKYQHINYEINNDGEINKSERWFYYEPSDNKTYMVEEENGAKYRMEAEGNLFDDEMSRSGDYFLLKDTYENIDLGSIAEYLASEDSLNVYRSKGEGYLYMKIYVSSVGPNAYEEIEIADFLIAKLLFSSDEKFFNEFVANYDKVTIEKPNLADYPRVY
ncbi:MAG: hypothetical protein EOM77_04905 [Bacteroidia bacterium]|nr:hypothetical protein [Bacteroidia bacterium]